LTLRNAWCYTAPGPQRFQTSAEEVSNGKQAFRLDGGLERFIVEAALAHIEAATVTSTTVQAIELAPFEKQ
jgi:hypothetical protein